MECSSFTATTENAQFTCTAHKDCKLEAKLSNKDKLVHTMKNSLTNKHHIFTLIKHSQFPPAIAIMAQCKSKFGGLELISIDSHSYHKLKSNLSQFNKYFLKIKKKQFCPNLEKL